MAGGRRQSCGFPHPGVGRELLWRRQYGGTHNAGTVFRVTATGVLTTLHSFSSAEGDLPQAALLQASDGNFYGTTSSGGGGTKGALFLPPEPAT